MNYQQILTQMMGKIAEKENSIFVGQQIVFYGNPMSKTIEHLHKDKMIETPVFEDTQMGMSLGLAMTGKIVVSFYPRWDFLILALNQLINHIDKFKLMTGKDLHMIIRVGKGSDVPLDPGHQHKGNYFNQIKDMCLNIHFMDCKTTDDIHRNYEFAIHNTGVYVINEYPELY
jgi:pyruvate/2-oxoglutarate/acetoin dehydrogenase E1 component